MIRTRAITLLGAAAVPVVALAAAGCGGGGGGATAASAPPKTAAPHVATVRVATNGKLGKILVNSQGRTLYLFQKDAGTKSACFGMCATAWPPLRTNAKPTVGGGASASVVGTTKRSDGQPQVTYNGHPLYTFVMDTQPGETTGEGVTAFGGRWFAISPAGKRVSGPAPKSGGGSSSSQPAAPAAPKKAPRPTTPPAPKSSPAPKKSPPKSNGIPQNNGGDQDSDNNGGPDDGDGGI